MSFATITAIKTGHMNKKILELRTEFIYSNQHQKDKKEQLVYHLNKEVAAVLLYITTIRLGY